MKEDEIIVPAPTALNPVPSLGIALKLDNRLPSQAPATLVFQDAALRTLLLRQDVQKDWVSAKDFGGKTTMLLHEDWPAKGTAIVVYMRPEPKLVASLIPMIRSCSSSVRLVFLPTIPAILSKVLAPIRNDVAIQALQMDLFPLEPDVIAMEYPLALKHSLETPSLPIATISRSLLKLQDVVGRIPRIATLGPLAEEVLRHTLSATVDEYWAGRPAPPESTDVAALLILDRSVDLVTPMTTPLTYEGLLDEVFGIQAGSYLDIDLLTIDPETAKNQDIAFRLHGQLYEKVRDQHVEQFGTFLQNQAHALKDSHSNFTNKPQKDLTEIHQFVKQIPAFTQNLRSLTHHIHLAEHVKNYSEDAVFRERWHTERAILEGEYVELDEWMDDPNFWRLLCLQSVCAGGISRYEAVRREVVQTLGYEALFVWQNLEKAGLLRRREGLFLDKGFHNLRKSLVLINAEVDTVDPDDISYVSSGYAPLSVRLVQTAVKMGIREDISKDLPGRYLDVTQVFPPEDLATSLKRSAATKKSLAPAESTNRKPVLMVMYVGGVTYMEIAALRFLSKRSTFPYRIVVVTTNVMNGSSLVESLS